MIGGHNGGDHGRDTNSSRSIGNRGARARVGGREVSGLNAERMREVVETINRARAAAERVRRMEASAGGDVGGEADRQIYAPANTPANGDESPGGLPLVNMGVETNVVTTEQEVPEAFNVENTGNTEEENENESDMNGSMLIVQMTVMDNGTSRELVALVGTDLSVEALHRIVSGGSPTIAPASTEMMNAIPNITLQIKGKMETEDVEESKGDETQADGTMQVDELTCVVCCEDFTHGEKVRQMPCNRLHCYHESCIMEWLGRHNSCPICRTKLENPPQEDGNEETSESSAETEVSARRNGQAPSASSSDGSPSQTNALAPSNPGEVRSGIEGDENDRSQVLQHILTHIRARALANLSGMVHATTVAPSGSPPAEAEPVTLRSLHPPTLEEAPEGIRIAVERELRTLRGNIPSTRSSAIDQAALTSAARTLQSYLQQLQSSQAPRPPRFTRRPPRSRPRPQSAPPPAPIEPPVSSIGSTSIPRRAVPRRAPEAPSRLPTIDSIFSQSALPRVTPRPFFMHNHRFAHHSQRSSASQHESQQPEAYRMNGQYQPPVMPPRMQSAVMDTSPAVTHVPDSRPLRMNLEDSSYTGPSRLPTTIEQNVTRQSLDALGGGIPRNNIETGRRSIGSNAAAVAATSRRPSRRPISFPTNSYVMRRRRLGATNNGRQQQTGSQFESAPVTQNITARRRRRDQGEVSNLELQHERSRRRKSSTSRPDQGPSQSMRSFPRRGLQRSSTFLGSVGARFRNLANNVAENSSSVSGEGNTRRSNLARSSYLRRSMPQLPVSTPNGSVSDATFPPNPSRSVELGGMQVRPEASNTGPSQSVSPSHACNTDATLSTRSGTSASSSAHFRAPRTSSSEAPKKGEGNVWKRFVKKVKKARRVLGTSSMTRSTRLRSGAASVASNRRRESTENDDTMSMTGGPPADANERNG
eukprot:Plantae.Rhodophyta-Hildenbrandia_rubra.ctg4413.p1 GENE.Plantae.Rhodophyta-Hildenbrandia_rubra.ctg4413~~Plantae.Rhodophyta-Hildenbrandia_rubra.ctg4413.p1  ORF type:complete len:932 (+),score=151.68 Plantae.Rhodophyta-Hildenbrandia_rubra.ctg4413:172-2967(+)